MDCHFGNAARAAWTAFALLAALGVVLTHHVTSYALVATLWGLVLVSRLTRQRAQPAPWDVALVVTIAVIFVTSLIILVAGTRHRTPV